MFRHCPNLLTLKAPVTTAADDIYKYFFIVFGEIRLDVSSESSARQRIHMKNQALFSSKDKSKKLKCRLLQFLFGALRVRLMALLLMVKFLDIFLADYRWLCDRISSNKLYHIENSEMRRQIM